MLKINHGKEYVQGQQKQIMKDHIIYAKVNGVIACTGVRCTRDR